MAVAVTSMAGFSMKDLGTKGDIMVLTNMDSLADLYLTLTWEKDGLKHSEHYFGDEVNLYRDFFPGDLAQKLLNKPVGETLSWSFEPGSLIPGYSEKKIHKIAHSQCNLRALPGLVPKLRKGRFYPKGILKGIAGVYSENITPFRVLDSGDRNITADFNHPLAGITLHASVEILDIKPKRKERGGLCYDWFEQLTDGPGIQSRMKGEASDFFSDRPFERDDENPDSLFYEKDRQVSHIDERARQTLSKIYGTTLENGNAVLDLMSSWQSHLPENLELQELHGIGMNARELAANKRLTSHTVHDLNAKPIIPCPDGSYDHVICSLSVEYLTRPFDIFREAARVLKKDGSLIVTFSNRWFPGKSIRLWKELHEFERMGLIAEYFLESGMFDRLETLSVRGYPRPYTDDYFPKLKLSDPIYMIRGFKSLA